MMLQEDIASPFRIVIADDDPIWLGSTARTLTGQGYLVRTFANGADAYEYLLSERFDLIIANVHMPKMDGMALLERVRSAPFIRTTPVILTSTDGSLESYREAVKKGADDYVTKPIEADFFKLKVHSILQRARRMDVLSEASYLGRFSPKYFSDILQLVSTTKRSGLMRIIRGPSLTQLWFRNGEVKFARDEAVEGVQAIFNLVRASNGRFEFIDMEPLETMNIQKPQMFLLLEFSRKLDLYNSSRKVNLKREFESDAEKLEQLIKSEAERYLPDVIKNCKLLLENGFKYLAEEDDVENAEAVKLKLYETLEWASQELKRLRMEFKRAEKNTFRLSQNGNKAPVAADKTVKEEPKIPPMAEETKETSTETPKEETKPRAKKQPEEPNKKSDSIRTIDLSKDEQGPSGGIFGENWNEFIHTVQTKLKENETDIPFFDEEVKKPVEPKSEDIPQKQPEVKPEPKPEKIEKASKPVPKPKPKEEKPESPRLIQRFPADVVEMMQVELGKTNPNLIEQTEFKRFSDSIKQDRRAIALPINNIANMLSESYYSKSNVMTVLVTGSSSGLQKFFSTVNGVELDKQRDGIGYLVRIPADFNQVLYLVGLNFEELDSFEAEGILDRGHGAIIVSPTENHFLEICIDSLTLSMVKYQRNRIFVVTDDKRMPARLVNQTKIYSLSNENVITYSSFKKAELEILFSKVVASFSPVTVL